MSRPNKSTSLSPQPAGRPSFHKHNTVDNLFASFYGFRGGRLLVQVIEATQLAKECNCYCELHFGVMKERTRTISKGERRAWREEFLFETEQSLDLRILCYKANKSPISKPKLLGQITIPVSSLLDGDIHKGLYHLTKEDDKTPVGKLELQLQYTSEMERNRDYILAKENKQLLMKCLTHQDLVLICVLCRTYETEELSKAVIRLFNSEGQALRLLVQLMFRDLKTTNNEDVLFRNDTISTKTTRNYFKMIGNDYVHHTLSQLIQRVIAFPKGYEVDPSKMKPEELPNLKQNQERLIEITHEFLDVIFDSTDRVPTKFLSLLRVLVKQCFPSKELRAIGTVLFLRFLVPAITTPQSYDIVPREVSDADARRALTLIAKIIQNLANEMKEFKEGYMQPLNSILSTNTGRIKMYLDIVSTVPAVQTEDKKRQPFTENDRLKCLALITGILLKNLNNFEEKLMEDPRMKDSATIQTVREQFHEVKSALEKPVDSLDVRAANKAEMP
ncbi:RasGTPase-activating protein [Planoprotostelium fungivorum]|uniref:RasGTPase-activating protein n=1 Tax=Planoprotostelium fungivorum TaxID=1890364 RepID=A0A2P6NWT2_9EUKA|nr:RasGTPase-activating protein [Planoprotostelium fungivorum]